MNAQARWLEIGDIRVAPVMDGYSRVPPRQFMPSADWDSHSHLIAADGLVHLPVGGFVVRTSRMTVLIDAGLGPVSPQDELARLESGVVRVGDVFDCGNLPAALSDIGVAPTDIDLVLCSHLHLDHAGWLIAQHKPFFPNARIRFGQAEWDALIETDDLLTSQHVREGMRALRSMGRIETIDGDMTSVAPGITARWTPGHTPGHQTFVISSGNARLIVLGDAVACPLQLAVPEWETLADADAALATRTRTALLKEYENDLLVGPHFPGLQAGRLMKGEGRRFFTG